MMFLGLSVMKKGPTLLTVKASITSWKFLFPTILFFIARKASFGLSADYKTVGISAEAKRGAAIYLLAVVNFNFCY